MCGIAGIVDLCAAREIDRDALQRMTDALRHRGPHGEGFYAAPGVRFGHRRLAVIDIEGGAQPFRARSRDAALSFNGEIYNFKELSRYLSGHGFSPRTASDTEVLAEGLAHEGAAFIQKLRGMFAFAFWDAESRRLMLARDRLGEKPLYYAETGDGFLVFASEIGALLASGAVTADIDPEAVADYFFYGFIPDPKTIYRGVKKLPPGHILHAAQGAPVILERYWRPVFSPNPKLSFDDASAMLRERIDDAVEAQMVADAPLGAFLSGGVDSAGIVAAMAEKSRKRLVTCTVGFHESPQDERGVARAFAEKIGADHHEHRIELNIDTLIDKVAAAFGEPFADSSALASYAVAGLARNHVTVALTGDGGDEIFAGYRRYPFFVAEERMRALAPQAVRRVVFGAAGAMCPKLDWAPRPFRAKTTLQALASSRADAYAAALAVNLPAQAAALPHPDLRRTLGDYRPQSVVAAALEEIQGADALTMAQYADIATWLPGRMLVKIDRASMAHSLETRPPLLDHELVQWAGALPPDYKLRAGVGKRVLKAALAPRLGRDWINRPKRGFDLPLAQWMRRDANNPLERLARSRAWRCSGLVDEKTVDRMIRRHGSGGADCAQALWSVIMFDAFLRLGQR
jgi:asparagine synthase (glutamine-hydrolysing)